MGPTIGRTMLGAGRLAHPVLGGGTLGPVMAIVFLLVLGTLVALLVIAIVRKPKPLQNGTVPADGALEIARGRLARGEIDPEQYVAIIAALRGDPVRATTTPASQESRPRD